MPCPLSYTALQTPYILATIYGHVCIYCPFHIQLNPWGTRMFPKLPVLCASCSNWSIIAIYDISQLYLSFKSVWESFWRKRSHSNVSGREATSQVDHGQASSWKASILGAACIPIFHSKPQGGWPSKSLQTLPVAVSMLLRATTHSAVQLVQLFLQVTLFQVGRWSRAWQRGSVSSALSGSLMYQWLLIARFYLTLLRKQ